MLKEYVWVQPTSRNFAVDRRRLRGWRRWREHFWNSPGFLLLKQIEWRRERLATTLSGPQRIYWLLPYRHRMRRIIAESHASAGPRNVEELRYYLAFCPREMIPACIWLIGRCAGRFRSYGVAEFRRDPSQQVRKHVAKALRRLEAWAQLEEMANLHPNDARIHWFAKSQTTHPPFTERLSNFMQLVDHSHADDALTPSRMPFWSLEHSWKYSPPKSARWIRRILRRIRYWVRRGVS